MKKLRAYLDLDLSTSHQSIVQLEVIDTEFKTNIRFEGTGKRHLIKARAFIDYVNDRVGKEAVIALAKAEKEWHPVSFLNLEIAEALLSYDSKNKT